MSTENLARPRGKSNDQLFDWSRTVTPQIQRIAASTSQQVADIDVQVEPLVEDSETILEDLDAYAQDVQDAIEEANDFAQEVFDDYTAQAEKRHANAAQFYLHQAMARVEQQVRIEEDSALSTRIDTVNASLAATNAAITTETTARVNGDAALASQITTVQTQANGNTAAVTSLQSSVDGIKARWGVAIDLNGRVVGLVQLDGQASGSTFLVVADKFIVSHPSDTGDTITPFVIGQVGGLNTVGINGNLVVDGTIIARHIAAGQIDASKINVATLSSIKANLGTVTAGVMQSADGKVVFDLNNKFLRMDT